MKNFLGRLTVQQILHPICAIIDGVIAVFISVKFAEIQIIFI